MVRQAHHGACLRASRGLNAESRSPSCSSADWRQASSLLHGHTLTFDEICLFINTLHSPSPKVGKDGMGVMNPPLISWPVTEPTLHRSANQFSRLNISTLFIKNELYSQLNRVELNLTHPIIFIPIRVPYLYFF